MRLLVGAHQQVQHCPGRARGQDRLGRAEQHFHRGALVSLVAATCALGLASAGTPHRLHAHGSPPPARRR
jgi:hypothetical protein